jgi:fumarate hydratase class I
MKPIQQDDLIESVRAALQYISFYHPVDYITNLARAYELEQSPAAKDAMKQILVNSRMCAEGHRPICQDTGIVTIFIKLGQECHLVKGDGPATMTLQEMCDEGVREAWLDPDNKLRGSILADPAFSRKNTKDNTPCVVDVSLVRGDKVDVTVAAKGGGSEAKSKFVMLNPSDSVVDWVLKTVPTMGAGWCPPGMLGIGIGGTAEKAMLLAKQSLMDPIDMQELKARGANTNIEKLRVELCDKINALGIGAQGLGGLTTVLDVKILDWPTHAANLPVAMIPNCAATRHAHFVLDGSGPVYLDPPSLENWPKMTYEAHGGKRVNLDTITREEPGRETPGRPQGSLHLLRRSRGSGARRSCRACWSNNCNTHGQVHAADAGADGTVGHDRQGRARCCCNRRNSRQQGCVPDGDRWRGVPRIKGDQEVTADRV